MRPVWIFLICVLTWACQKESENPLSEISALERVEIQQILIAFGDSLPGKTLERTREEAEALAQDIFKKVKAEPGKFDEMLVAHSDDMVPGIYKLVNRAVKPQADEIPRERFRSGLGDLAFSLKVGEIGIVPYDKESSPYGFHIVKRLR